MKTNRTEYLFSVNIHVPPTMAVDPGEEFTVQVRGAFDDVEDISTVPTPFAPACDGHPLAPMAGPIVVRGAKPGDVANLTGHAGSRPTCPYGTHAIGCGRDRKRADQQVR